MCGMCVTQLENIPSDETFELFAGSQRTIEVILPVDSLTQAIAPALSHNIDVLSLGFAPEPVHLGLPSLDNEIG